MGRAVKPLRPLPLLALRGFSRPKVTTGFHLRRQKKDALLDTVDRVPAVTAVAESAAARIVEQAKAVVAWGAQNGLG